MSEPSRDETPPADHALQSSHTNGAERPRVWTVFAATGLAFFLAIMFQVCLGAILAMIELGRGVKPEELRQAIIERLSSPYAMILTMALSQMALGLVGFLSALWSPLPFRERVAWTRARPSGRVYPMAMLGSIVPLAMGLAAAEAVTKLIPADQSILKFFDALTVDSAVVFVLFVGIAPAVFEEVLFRGYMQQRLVKRWGAAKGIVVTAIVFGLFHITPHGVAVALPLGFWFGYIAWRSGSILPAMLCHFFVNSGLNAWRMIIKFGELSEATQNVVHACAVLIGIICIATCFWPAFWREQVRTE